MTLKRRYIVGFLAVLSTAAAMPAQAAPTPIAGLSAPVHSASYVQYAQNMISPSQAKAIAAKRVRGAKFVDISRSGSRYRVRMLRKNGRVVDVLIDAATGRVLN